MSLFREEDIEQAPSLLNCAVLSKSLSLSYSLVNSGAKVNQIKFFSISECIKVKPSWINGKNKKEYVSAALFNVD